MNGHRVRVLHRSRPPPMQPCFGSPPPRYRMLTGRRCDTVSIRTFCALPIVAVSARPPPAPSPALTSSDAEPELLESWVTSQSLRGVPYQAGPLFLRHIVDHTWKLQLRSYLESLPCYYVNQCRQGVAVGVRLGRGDTCMSGCVTAGNALLCLCVPGSSVYVLCVGDR